jgi:8-oxo-dGTP diphosphatase
VIWPDYRAVLMGLRHRDNKHAPGQWAFPGGWLEPGETPEQCAARELVEETNLFVTAGRIKRYAPHPVAHTFFGSGVQAVTLYYACRYDENKMGWPKVMEAAKCEEWRWVSVLSLPRPLMESMREEDLRLRDFLVAPHFYRANHSYLELPA